MKEDDETRFLKSLTEKSERRMIDFENSYSISKIASVIDRIPYKHISNGVSNYQKVIRNNEWYFPVLCDVELNSFLERWEKVHDYYFKTAEDIFTMLAHGASMYDLANYSLLDRVIHSETMRGWVGKRSPSGLDALLNNRIMELTDLLSVLDDKAVEDVFSCGGVFVGNSKFITAESEMIKQFATYNTIVGQELTLEKLADVDISANIILRNFCRYSIKDFNEKHESIHSEKGKKFSKMTSSESFHIVEKQISGFSSCQRNAILKLLSEIRVLNHLNLNLEVKYSFKGWAGLMHILVFVACFEVTAVSNNVYEALNKLI